ncbi:MAG: InlB B-repeat-containing protein, partial [Clostridia bacterium]|nr:InlB B-repeat-containing protein [Clostridia bacterium]
WRVRTALSDSFATIENGTSALLSNQINATTVGVGNTYAQESGVIYIYPEMKPLPQTFIRYDYIFKNVQHNGYRGNPLSFEEAKVEDAFALLGSALMGEPINGLTMTDQEKETGVYNSYPGYLLHVCDESCPDLSKDPTAVLHYPDVYIKDSNQITNIVYRLYDPIEYRLTFLNAYSMTSSTYTYGTHTEVPNPVRKGYTFTGWTIEIYRDGEWVTVDTVAPDFVFGDKAISFDSEHQLVDPNAIYASEKNVDPEAEYAYEIRLTAGWSANTYNIIYDLGSVKVEADLTHNATLPAQFTFDALNEDGEKLLAISDPKRSGYTFDGWTLVQLNEEGNAIAGTEENCDASYVLTTDAYDKNLKLTARWSANKYSVTLNGNGATEAGTASIGEVIFDTRLTLPEDFKTPVREGHTFDGFWSALEGGVQYIDAEGVAVEKAWEIYETDENGDAVLYARWIVNDYRVTVDVDIPNGITSEDVTVQISCKGADGVWGNPVTVGSTGIDVPYGTEYKVTVTVNGNYKVVRFGTAEYDAIPAHANPFTVGMIAMPAHDVALHAVILPVIADPTDSIRIDYKSETLGGLPDGSYRIYWEGVALEITVNSGSITVNGEAVSAVAIPNDFFGKDNVKLVRYGDGVSNADTDAFDISFAARPEQPRNDIDNVDHTNEDRLIVTMKPDVEVDWYEFAVWNKNDPALLPDSLWQSSTVLTAIGPDEADHLKPGTRYYVFVRVKATDTAPHGEIYVTDPYTTASSNYIKDRLDYLDSLAKEYGEGPNVTELINGAKEKIQELAKNPENLYELINQEIAKVEKAIALEKLKDDRVAALKTDLDKYLGSDSYTAENRQKLQDIYQRAYDTIAAATASADVENAYNSAVVDMSAIPVTYLYDNDRQIMLESQLGLPYGSHLNLTIQNLESVNRAVIEAIRAGKLSVGGDFMTVRDAQRVLRELDVIANYTFKLDGDVQSGDMLTMHLKITDELKGHTGLHVAYYNSETGMLELLETELSEDGSELIFKSSRVSNFVILADATVELIGVIAALGAVLLCQIVAIVALIIGRVRGKKNSVHACTALPTVFLAVKFVPVNAELLVMIMSVLAIVLQIVLMVLLLTSFAVFKGHSVKRASRKDSGKDTEDGEGNAQDESIETAVAVEDVEEQDGEASEESVETFEEASEVEDKTEAEDLFEDAEDEDDPFAVYDETDATEENAYGAEEYDGGDADFIEPAPDPRYSLEDEELFAAYDGEDANVVYEDEDIVYADEDIIYADEDIVYADEETYADEAVYAEDTDADAEDNRASEVSDEDDALYRYDE